MRIDSRPTLTAVIKHDALSLARGGAGVVGATVGGALGLLPGVGYGIARGLSERPERWEAWQETARDCDDYWPISHVIGGATLAGLGTYLATCDGLTSTLAAVGTGIAGYAVQHGFRALGQRTARLPYDSEVFPVTLTHCANKEMARDITNPFNGALSGVREGAYLGKLAFQDFLVPSLTPNQSTPYKG